MTRYIFDENEAIDISFEVITCFGCDGYSGPLCKTVRVVGDEPLCKPQDEWLKSHEYEERTCEIEGTDSDEFGIYDRLSCGHVAMRQEPEPTEFCPRCGAKVVNND